MKKYLFAIFITSTTFCSAYNYNSISSKYYRGEVSQDEYLDSLGAPSYKREEFTIYYNDGTKSLIVK